MNKHLIKAVDHFSDHGFVTECDVSSIMVNSFRKELGYQLEKNGIEFEVLALEVKGQYMYSFYNASEFPVYLEMKSFIIKYMEQRC